MQWSQVAAFRLAYGHQDSLHISLLRHYFLYCATTADDFIAYLTNNATRAAYPAVTAITFEKAELLIPVPALLKEFGDKIIPMAEQVHTLQRQIQNLRRTHDRLLPRLMSGQIDVELNA
jgi:type I restriction enzyme S subunit